MPSPINMDVFLLLASLTALDVLPLVVMEISIMIFNTRQILKVVDQHHQTYVVDVFMFNEHVMFREKGLEKSEESEGNGEFSKRSKVLESYC